MGAQLRASLKPPEHQGNMVQRSLGMTSIIPPSCQKKLAFWMANEINLNVRTGFLHIPRHIKLFRVHIP